MFVMFKLKSWERVCEGRVCTYVYINVHMCVYPRVVHTVLYSPVYVCVFIAYTGDFFLLCLRVNTEI